MCLCLQSVNSARTFSRRSARLTGLRCLSETHLQHPGRPTERRSPSPLAWRSSPAETRWTFAVWIQTSPRGRCSVLTRGSWCPKTSRLARFPGSWVKPIWDQLGTSWKLFQSQSDGESSFLPSSVFILCRLLMLTTRISASMAAMRPKPTGWGQDCFVGDRFWSSTLKRASENLPNLFWWYLLNLAC